MELIFSSSHTHCNHTKMMHKSHTHNPHTEKKLCEHSSWSALITEQVILFRLRTGHNRLNAHMYNKFKVGESETCPCYADIKTAEHLLQHCPLHDAMRRDTWPEPTLLRDKLYGNLEELRRTAAFVRATGISI